MENELISVIIPIYNVEKYLRRCIDSIIHQTYTNLEIILVDDESPDKCGEICDEYAQKDKRVRVIHQKNKGLSGARNAGIDIARGEYIGFVDSDDYIELNMYESLYSNIISYNATMAICSRFYEFEDGRKVLRYKPYDSVKEFSNVGAIVEMNSFSSFDMSAWDKLYHKSLWVDLRYPEGKLSEDFFVIFKLLDRCEKVVYNPEPLYHYIQRQNSISRNKKINVDFIEAGKQQMMYLSDVHPELLDIGKAAYASANMTVYNFYIKSKVACPNRIKKEMKQAVRQNIKSVVKIDWPADKKIQALLFAYFTGLYNVMFRCLRKIKEV